MKNIKFITIMALASLIISGCEKNDPIEELGETGGIAANIYFVPINPIAFNGSTIETEVEYWSPGDDFTKIELLHYVLLLDDIKLELKDVTYSYRYEGSRDKIEQEVKKNLTHRFTDFVPERSAYVIRPTYEVPAEYKKVSYKKNNTTLSSLNMLMSEEAKEDFFSKISSGLSMAQLQTILVDVNGIVSQTTFDSYYQDGSLTDTGRESVTSNLKTIGIPGLIKDNFSYDLTHRIGISFRIVNIAGEVAESNIRAFNVI